MQENQELILGIDTGGTYTDAVIVRPGETDVLAKAKVPTNHFDLAGSVSKVMEAVFKAGPIDPERVGRLALSTTLATNAVVEERGGKVGLFVIGTTKPFDLPAEAIRFLDGGHDHLGREVKPLDLEALVDAVALMRPHTDAYAVCAAMSMENPAHEKVAAKAIELIDPKPIFCSHQVSSKAGMKERAATALINARLLPVMQSFVKAVRDSLLRLGMTAGVSVIRGDGGHLPLDQAVKRAAETVASGPAASVVFGCHHFSGQAALVVDVGGTTTDISRIEDGRPIIKQDGSMIGRWKTHVRAVDTYTVGVGGDSRVSIARDGRIVVGPWRVVPVCMDQEVAEPGNWFAKVGAGICILAGNVKDEDVGADPVLDMIIRKGATSFESLLADLPLAESILESRINELAHARRIRIVGFTPTDALHVLGRLHLADGGRSRAAARSLAAGLAMEPEEFCRQVIKMAQEKIARAIVDYLFRAETGHSLSGFFPHRRQSRLLDVQVRLRLPVIGLGAAARTLLPAVAEMLGTELVLAENYQVGSALGAVLALG